MSAENIVQSYSRKDAYAEETVWAILPDEKVFYAHLQLSLSALTKEYRVNSAKTLNKLQKLTNHLKKNYLSCKGANLAYKASLLKNLLISLFAYFRALANKITWYTCK